MQQVRYSVLAWLRTGTQGFSDVYYLFVFHRSHMEDELLLVGISGAWRPFLEDSSRPRFLKMVTRILDQVRI